jgi:uncharacterized protein
MAARRWVNRRHNLVIRDATPNDFGTICALNLAAISNTSAMNVDRLATLHRLSCYHKVGCVEGSVAAFLLAMRKGARYENENFAWFDCNYNEFIYVDRIVVSSSFRGMNLGSFLYEDLFRYARDNGIPHVTCEYNIVPPNEASRSFHDKFGFKEQGTQWTANGSKRVSLQLLVL